MIGITLKRKKIVDENEDSTNFYSPEVVESLLENDELSPSEEAFMQGYDAA